MKKFAIFALCFVFAFLCIGCGDNQNRGLADGANQETIEVLEPEPDSESETPGQSASEPEEEESAVPEEDKDQSEAPPENSDEGEVQEPEQEEENDSTQPETGEEEAPAEGEDHEHSPGESDKNQDEPEVLDSVAQLQNQILQTFGIEIDLFGVESAAEVSATETNCSASLFLQESFESFVSMFAHQFKEGGKLFESTTKFEVMAGFYLTAEMQTLNGTVAITLMISDSTSCSLMISK